MQWHPASALLAAFLLAGCIVQVETGPGHHDGQPSYDDESTDCRSGPGRFFLEALDASSWVGDRFYAIDRQGRLWGFHAGFPSTMDNVTAKYARLANLTAEQAERAFANLSLPTIGVGYNLSAAYVGALPQGFLGDLCAKANEGWYRLAAHYPDPNCYDANTWNITVSTARGLHTTSAYCGAGPDDFDRFVDLLVDVIVGAENANGILA